MLKRLDSKYLQTDYFTIQDVGKLSPKSKTHKYIVTSRLSSTVIGQIKWYKYWRKYCFYPSNDIILDAKCMEELGEALDLLTKDYKRFWKTILYENAVFDILDNN